jgi:hypothetical protein
MYTCPCCGFEVYDSPPGSYDICPICYWEDDAQQLFFPLNQGGANQCSLVEAQVNFVQFGACTRSVSKNVRLPLPNDRRDPLWFPLWARKIEVPDDEKDYARFQNESSVKALCYWLRGT